MVKNDLVLKAAKVRNWDLRIRFTKVNYETDGKNIYRRGKPLDEFDFFVAMVAWVQWVSRWGVIAVVAFAAWRLCVKKNNGMMEEWNIG